MGWKEDFLIDVGKKVARRRKDLCLSISEVAFHCKLSRNTIASIEAGKGTSLFNLLSIAEVLDSEIHLLFPANRLKFNDSFYSSDDYCDPL